MDILTEPLYAAIDFSGWTAQSVTTMSPIFYSSRSETPNRDTYDRNAKLLKLKDKIDGWVELHDEFPAWIVNGILPQQVHQFLFNSILGIGEVIPIDSPFLLSIVIFPHFLIAHNNP